MTGVREARRLRTREALLVAARDLFARNGYAATTVDDDRPHPAGVEIEDYLRGLPWVEQVGSRVRDQGHVLHVEAFVVPRRGRTPSMRRLMQARDGCLGVDWKAQDVALVLVDELPAEVGGPSREHQSERSS